MRIKDMVTASFKKTEEEIRFSRIRMIFDILRNKGEDGKEFIRKMDIEKYYNDGLSTYKEIPKDYQFFIGYKLSDNKNEFLDREIKRQKLER